MPGDDENMNGCFEQSNLYFRYLSVSYGIIFMLISWYFSKRASKKKFILLHISSLVVHLLLFVLTYYLVNGKLVGENIFGTNFHHEMKECTAESLWTSIGLVFLIVTAVILGFTKAFIKDTETKVTQATDPPSTGSPSTDAQSIDAPPTGLPLTESTDAKSYRGTSTTFDPLIERNMQIMSNFQSVLSS